MKRTNIRLKICIFLLICNLAFIWGNSLLPAELSQAFSDWVKGTLFGMVSEGDSGEAGSTLVRKLAHFTEFAALGMLLRWLFGMLGRTGIPAFACGAAAACIDETIQMFVPERGPGILDVLLDCSGVLAGMLLLHLGHTYIQKKTNYNHSEE